MLTKNENLNCQILNIDNDIYMCAYLGMDDTKFGYTKIMFLVNGKHRDMTLSDEDVVSLTTDYNLCELADIEDAQRNLDNWLTTDVAEFVNDWELYD